MADSFILDKPAIMDRLGGDEEIFSVMVDMYLQDVGSYSGQLAAALAAGDHRLLQREAHTVKGLLATFADDAGSAMALALEQQLKRSEHDGLAAGVARLQQRLELVAEALRRETA